MNGWGSQWYGKLPAALNVYENVSPWISVPERKTPVSELTVCGMSPLFVQQTVVPTATVSMSGSNAKSTIDTRVDPGSHGCGGGGPAWPLIAGVLPTSAQIATASVSAAK
jgi:hypothetical protein